MYISINLALALFAIIVLLILALIIVSYYAVCKHKVAEQWHQKSYMQYIEGTKWNTCISGKYSQKNQIEQHPRVAFKKPLLHRFYQRNKQERRLGRW